MTYTFLKYRCVDFIIYLIGTWNALTICKEVANMDFFLDLMDDQNIMFYWSEYNAIFVRVTSYLNH